MHLIAGKIGMEQKITIRIGEKKYAMTAKSPEQEEIYRLAAASVNKMLSLYTDKFPGKELTEILSLVALNESIGGITAKKKLDALMKDIDSLETQTDTYLENIDGQPLAKTR